MQHEDLHMQLIKAFASGKVDLAREFEDKSKLRLGSNGEQLWDYPTTLMFSGAKPFTVHFNLPTSPEGSLEEGDDVQIEGLTVRFYTAKAGGTGVAFSADRIRKAGTSSAVSASSTSSKAPAPAGSAS